MRLDKRYFDMVAANGDYLIGYDAAAHIGPASLRYRALLSSSPAFVRARYGIGHPGVDFPTALTFGGAVEWNAAGASPSGVAASAGPMEWRVDQIGLGVRASVGQQTIEGRGYVETVRLMAPPWRLGVRTIRWGRFVGEKSWAVWNIVEGNWPIRLFAINGRASDTFSASDTVLAGDAGSIRLGETVRTVNDGDVVQSQLPAVAPLIRMLARRAFVIQQRKVVRAAQLTDDNGDTESGLAMDEFVQMRRETAA